MMVMMMMMTMTMMMIMMMMMMMVMMMMMMMMIRRGGDDSQGRMAPVDPPRGAGTLLGGRDNFCRVKFPPGLQRWVLHLMTPNFAGCLLRVLSRWLFFGLAHRATEDVGGSKRVHFGGIRLGRYCTSFLIRCKVPC